MGAQDVTVRVLLVEDDEVDQRAILRAFRRAALPCEVTVVEDGREALDVLRGANGRERLPRPYLVLLDLNLPRMDGIELLRELRRDPELARTVVFVLTTSNAEEDRQAAYGLNVAGYMVKAAVAEGGLRPLTDLLGRYCSTVELP